MKPAVRADALDRGVAATAPIPIAPDSVRNFLKIAILASGRNTSIARMIMSGLEAAGHETAGVRFNESWRAESRATIETLLAGASHLLSIIDQPDSESGWFAYVLGLARGRTQPFALYAARSNWKPAPWLQDVACFTSIQMLIDYYKQEQIDWNSKEERRSAKANLLELGISWHAESMAQCVRDGDTKAVDLFVRSGLPPDVRDKSGVPMLCLAARFKHRSIVELLLERGAAIDAQSDDRGYTALMDAAQQGDAGLLKFLLEAGADPNACSKDGQTALILAVGRTDASMVALLIAHGADPDIADKLGLSARKYANLFNNPQITELFKGA